MAYVFITMWKYQEEPPSPSWVARCIYELTWNGSGHGSASGKWYIMPIIPSVPNDRLIYRDE